LRQLFKALQSLKIIDAKNVKPKVFKQLKEREDTNTPTLINQIKAYKEEKCVGGTEIARLPTDYRQFTRY